MAELGPLPHTHGMPFAVDRVAHSCEGEPGLFQGHLLEDTLMQASPSIRRSNRPMLEHLEDRLTPTTAHQLIFTAPVLQARDNYLDSYYQSMLAHEPDSQGLPYWSAQIQNGVSAATVAASIWNSPEHRALEVNLMFQQLLGRDAGTPATDFFVAQFQAGATEQQVMTTIVLSSEFTNGDTSSAAYVNNLYEKVLGRAPDASAAKWAVSLSTGSSRSSVAQAFILSTEALTNAVDTYYENFLQRAPSNAEAEAWVTSMHNSQNAYESAALSILGSSEYMTLASATPQAPMPPLW
jgi:hypothetical protein